jgi:pyruvate formate lyase activating enzyme
VHIFFRERCTLNGRCVETCYSHALQIEGRLMTVQQVMEEILADRKFYENSGGGVTLSGGEPALSKEFALKILQQCKLNDIHTAIETCGECPWTALEALLPVTDLVMMDIKHIADDKHRAATGQSNERILENARRLALTDKPIIFRTPVVPTVNDSNEEIGQIASFVRDLIELRRKNNSTAGISYELLAFHKLASDKYPSLGLEYKAAAVNPPTKEHMARLAEEVKRCGLEVSMR